MMLVAQFLRKLVNIKFRFIRKAFGNSHFRLLDVGAGNRSASKTKSVFPHCEYYGLDIDRKTNYTEADFQEMHTFYELDLTSLDYSGIPDQYFDYINMAHVIEHLHNGDLVVPLLIQKLKPGGFFYIEYPGAKSLTLPSMYGTLNFHDDPTHVRVYSVKELESIFVQNNCEVLQKGTRRNYYYIAALPFRLVISLFRTGKINANIFWDLLGFAEFLYVRKKQ